MDYLGNKSRRKLELLKTVVKLSVHQNWITEKDPIKILQTTESEAFELERALCQFLIKVKSDETASKLLCALRCINEVDVPPKSTCNKNSFVSRVMSKLCEKSLITEEEKLEFERKLETGVKIDDIAVEEMNSRGRVLSIPKTTLVTQLIRKKIRRDAREAAREAAIEANKANEIQFFRNPLEHPPVIKHVFPYLDTDDVKKLRFVSKEWSSAGLGTLFTRSNIILRSPEDASNFLQLFSKTSYEMIPFRKYTFLSEVNGMWPVEELGEFLKKQGEFITELEFKNLQLVNSSSEQILETWNITSWITECAMKEQSKTKWKTKLLVICMNERTNISVDFNALDCFKEITLKNVTVNLQDGIRISPTKLTLSDVTFMKDGQIVAQLHLNDVVDFSKATCVSLESFVFSRNVRLSLELNGNGKLDQLTLLNVPLVHIETCRWEVNKLTTYKLTLPEQTQMQIKELSVQSYSNALINISDLPTYIENLSLVGISKTAFLLNEPVDLKYIKVLHLTLMKNFWSLFAKNFKFPNLTHLYLEKKFLCLDDMELDLAMISRTVKVIHLTRMKIINAGNDGLSLDRLILKNAESFNIEAFCASHVTTKELVLDFSCQFTWKPLHMQIPSIIDILKHQNVCQNCAQRCFVGPIGWIRSKTDFDSCPLRLYLDRKADYYLFENQKGKAIEENEFNSLNI